MPTVPSESTIHLLTATGFSPEQTKRYLALEGQGRTDACVRMLRSRRCELVDALHEAQRPIDVLDWAIRDLMRRA